MVSARVSVREYEYVQKKVGCALHGRCMCPLRAIYSYECELSIREWLHGHCFPRDGMGVNTRKMCRLCVGVWMYEELRVCLVPETRF
jgi:hypothetical protein